MKVINFLIVSLSLSVESVLSGTCNFSKCGKDGAYLGTDDDDKCCAEGCKNRDICENINIFKEVGKKRKNQCQRRKSICRFVPSGRDLSFDDTSAGFIGQCLIKTASDDVCNTFGRGCILSTTSTSQGACVIKEGRKCMQNGCKYQLLPDTITNNLISNPILKSECVSKPESVSKQDDCTAFIGDNKNQCTKANGCAYDPCTEMCSFDCTNLEQRKCESKQHKYQCRYVGKNGKKRCLNQ